MKRIWPLLLISAVVASGLTVVALRFLPIGWVLPGVAANLASESAGSQERSDRTRPTAPPPSSVVALGRLQPQGGVIELSATPGDRVAQVLVEPGAEVQTGQELVRLESYAVRAAEKRFAELALDEARQRQELEAAYGKTLVNEAEIGVDSAELAKLDIKVQEARLEVLTANLAVAVRDFQRLADLKDTLISDQQREHQRLVVEQAKAELAGAQATIDKLKQTQQFGVRQAREKVQAAAVSRDRMVSAVQLSTLEQNVKLADARLEMAVVRAPLDGKILQIVTHVGETVGQMPILRMGDTAHMVAAVEVYETDVSRVAIGQPATITSEALSQPLRGTVSYVGTMVAKNEVLSLDPTRSADLRVMEVRVALDEQGTAQAARFVNLQVQVAIETPNER